MSLSLWVPIIDYISIPQHIEYQYCISSLLLGYTTSPGLEYSCPLLRDLSLPESLSLGSRISHQQCSQHVIVQRGLESFVGYLIHIREGTGEFSESRFPMNKIYTSLEYYWINIDKFWLKWFFFWALGRPLSFNGHAYLIMFLSYWLCFG